MPNEQHDIAVYVHTPNSYLYLWERTRSLYTSRTTKREEVKDSKDKIEGRENVENFEWSLWLI